MKKLALTLWVLFAFAPSLSTLPFVATQMPASAATKLAPADEYFGPLSMSVLGIRNALNDAALRLDRGSTTNFDDAVKHAMLVESSVRDWEAKYPRDNWLPRTILALHRVYDRIPTEEGNRHSVETAKWLFEKYAASTEAQTVRDEMSQTVGRR